MPNLTSEFQELTLWSITQYFLFFLMLQDHQNTIYSNRDGPYDDCIHFLF